jgi:hypothetical protein
VRLAAHLSRQHRCLHRLRRKHRNIAGVTSPLALSTECRDWARTANYAMTEAEDGTVVFRSETDSSAQYFIRRRGVDRLQLTQSDEDHGERPVLFVARVEVLERYLLGLFADDLRDDLDLPFLELPWDADQIAPGFAISDAVRGWRTLIRTGYGSVGAAPDPTLSLVTLVPLSHLLLWPAAAVKASFLHETGAPLLRAGSYAPPPAS